MSVFAIRLKEARLKAGISQEKLGIDAGLDEMSASARMNRYELGKRVPDLDLIERFADVLNVPMTYFFAVEQNEADLLLAFQSLDVISRHEVLKFIGQLKK
jgi:transcriptional regulator with XRE-family HTH domain